MNLRKGSLLVVEKLRIIVTQIFIAGLMVMLSISCNAWEDTVPLMSTLLFVVGIVLVGIASLGRLWCSLYIAGYKTDKLIIVGPYSMTRNPLYFFSLLGGIGVGFATETFSIPILIAVAFAIYYHCVIRSEEEELRQMHGNQFRQYEKRAPRFWPRIPKLFEPEEYTVKPIIFRKHIFHALWFIWIVGLLEIVEAFHELKYLPMIFKLY